MSSGPNNWKHMETFWCTMRVRSKVIFIAQTLLILHPQPFSDLDTNFIIIACGYSLKSIPSNVDKVLN